MSFACQYCHKEFKSERTLMVHMCERKRRWDAKDEKAVVLAMHTYTKFYEDQDYEHRYSCTLW